MELVELQEAVESTGNRDYVEALKKKHLLNDLLGSRFSNVTEMDAPSKFFFGFESKNGQKRFIHAVQTESGDLVSKPTEIREQTVSFFSRLYESELSTVRDIDDDFLHGLSKLGKESSDWLDSELTLDELGAILGGMENGRLPGIDGLPVPEVLKTNLIEGQPPLKVAAKWSKP